MLRKISSESSSLLQGDVWNLELQATDADNRLVDTTLIVAVAFPQGVPSLPVVTRTALGHYRASVTVSEAGRYTAVASATGYGTAGFTAHVQGITANADMPTVADVQAYAPTETSGVDEDIIAEAIEVELADQRSRCSIPAVYDVRLAQALKRRVQLNLAWRDTVLTTNVADAEAGTTLQPIYRDPVVSRLEGPFRRVFFA